LLAVNDVDELNHQYNGFSDNYSFATNEFTYNANGNMLSDNNKDLDMIDYNYLNLPQQINFSEGYQEINYLYTANGQKLMKQTRTENAREQTVDYIGSFVYENDQLRYILTEEGRALAKSNGTFEYQYFLKDHLGNTRITVNQNGQIMQEDAYYPFGMPMNGLCYQSGVDYENKYLYNGKELQDDFGLDWYDYGARMYDAVIGRWHVQDNNSEKFYSVSPYNYGLNNPINVIDPDGNEPIKPLAGTISGFVIFMNNLSTGLGKTTGAAARAGMLRMGQTKFTFKGPKPANTAPFNTSGGNRYIYTKKGGWVDMAHFMFYAGKGYQYKQDGEKYPVGKALQDGLLQEMGDMINADHSAFSYEDLPSDKFGAQFGADFFDPESDLTFAEQLQNYFNDVLGATNPEDAPNYDKLPEADDTSTPPTETNMSSTPKHTTDDEEE